MIVPFQPCEAIKKVCYYSCQYLYSHALINQYMDFYVFVIMNIQKHQIVSFYHEYSRYKIYSFYHEYSKHQIVPFYHEYSRIRYFCFIMNIQSIRLFYSIMNIQRHPIVWFYNEYSKMSDCLIVLWIFKDINLFHFIMNIQIQIASFSHEYTNTQI